MAGGYHGQIWEQRHMAAAEKAGREAKECYTKEARRLYQNITPEQAGKELKRLERGKGILGWIWDRWEGFWNMVKTAIYSVLLGRQAAERRISAGNREEEARWQREEARKEAKISVLEEKIKEWEAKEPGDKEPAQETETREKTSESGQEPVEPDQEPGQKNGDMPVPTDLNKEEEDEPVRKNDEAAPRKPGDYSRLGIQCEQMTKRYQRGLTKFLEDQMEIGAGNIHVANGSKNSIQISLWPPGEEKPRFCMEIKPNGSVHYPSGSLGEDRESRAFQGALLKSVLYYTAKVYDYGKDKELSRYGFEPGRISIKPGTVPSAEMVERVLKKETAYLFGHKIECRKGKEETIVRIDGKAVGLGAGQAVEEAVRGAMKEKIFGDYKRIHELSKKMKRFVAKNHGPFHDLAKSRNYSCEEISGMIHKLVQDRTSDGSPDIIRADSLCGHLITLQTERVSSLSEHKDYQRIVSARIDGRMVYKANVLDKRENIQELRAILQKENVVAGTMLWNSLCMALEKEKKLQISEKTNSIQAALSGRKGQITDLDPESGQRTDTIASCIREGDIQTMRELFLLGHGDDIQKSYHCMRPETLTAEMTCLLEVYGIDSSRTGTQGEKEMTPSLKQEAQDTIEPEVENEK